MALCAAKIKTLSTEASGDGTICWMLGPAKPLQKSLMPRVSVTFPISTTYSSEATAWRPENFVAP
jgi:hypothetical protein